MKWNALTDVSQLQDIVTESKSNRILLFKHSTRCSVSNAALNRLERSWNEEDMKRVKAYFLDLLSHRDISRAIAELFRVEHESPQVLVIDNGQSIYTTSHLGIEYSKIKEIIEN